MSEKEYPTEEPKQEEPKKEEPTNDADKKDRSVDPDKEAKKLENNDGDKENKEIDKAGEGGVKSWLGIDQIDWGGEAGKFYECWKLNPCCGTPEPLKMITCFVCWTCCGCCSQSKLYASTVGQECAFIPHCLMAFFLPCITSLIIRTNIRNRLGVQGNMVGDAVCCCCCGCCSICQELRAVPREEWHLLEPKWKTPVCSAPEIIFIK
ncbi:hypothetical protein, conserved [Angomonas deanei]|uniref:PLAC8 family n=1 Tax=Angomonas deanei TaxID=59799 RepID=A0A7G2CUC1_9TRYP|nr:hypothetical protein, conserved [Angomonas deanei]CAD2222899.1 hypothetical protein, conserved [Angomonas deanei]CAD2222900.1 hypothetical protein, conserved [Angomonas deanei]